MVTPTLTHVPDSGVQRLSTLGKFLKGNRRDAEDAEADAEKANS
jgi:hypothetical protein